MSIAVTSNFLMKTQLEKLLHNQPDPVGFPPSALYVALFTTTSTNYFGEEDGTLSSTPGNGLTAYTEVSTSNTNYTRAMIPCDNASWNKSTSGELIYTNAIDIVFNTPSNSVSWGTITGIGLFDAQTNGKAYYLAPVSTQKTIQAGDGAPKILAGALQIRRA